MKSTCLLGTCFSSPHQVEGWTYRITGVHLCACVRLVPANGRTCADFGLAPALWWYNISELNQFENAFQLWQVDSLLVLSGTLLGSIL